MEDSVGTYEDWLALSAEEQRRLHFSVWDTHARMGYGFALTAAGRLAIVSEVRVLDAMVGTYHGGEYLLHMYVADEDFPSCPPPLQQAFEGFRVYWLPMSHHYASRK